MKLFLDSTKPDEIRHALELWDVDGLTTNPRLVRRTVVKLKRASTE